jgi:hypothetical protein
VTVTDPGFTGTYQVSGCSGVATYGAVSNGTLAVTSFAAGQCTITVSDSFNQTTISVTVTTLSVPVQ